VEEDEGQQLAEVRQALDEARERLGRIAAIYDQLEADGLDTEGWLKAKAALGPELRALWDAEKPVGEALGATSATDRMKAYLLDRLGEVVTNYELFGVAGTLEWARRVRELEVQEGWAIDRGVSAGLRPGEYRLRAAAVDADRAEAWRVRNEVRRQPGAGSDRCLAYLKRIYPGTASKEDLAYVSRINEWPRRMRELEEAGWDVVSSVDDPTLPAGSYRLGSLDQGPPRAREAIKQRERILARDGWACQKCGAQVGKPAGTRLQVHHRHQVKDGGGNDDENLVSLCVPCHAGEHSLTGDEVDDELLNPSADPDAQ
jgi:hypothetical protein